MIKTVNKGILFFMMSIIMMIPGCWNYKEINQLAIAGGVAIDLMGDEYIVTVEIVDTKAGEKGVKVSSKIVSARGVSIFEGVRNLIVKIDRKIYWSHAKVIVISEEVAKGGVLAILDWVDRDAEIRSDMWLLVSKNKPAREVLETSMGMEQVVSFQLDDLLKINKKIYQTIGTELWDFSNQLATEQASGTLPTVDINVDHGKKIPAIYGTAVFKNKKMIGWLDGMETRSFSWVKGEPDQDGILYTLHSLGNKRMHITLEIFRGKSEKKPTEEDGALAMEIDLKLEAGIAEISESLDLMDRKLIESIEKELENHIKEDLENVIKKVQKEYNSDIFFFGDVIRRENPKKWKEIEKDWDKIFPVLKTNVHVEVDITGSALISKNIK